MVERLVYKKDPVTPAPLLLKLRLPGSTRLRFVVFLPVPVPVCVPNGVLCKLARMAVRGTVGP